MYVSLETEQPYGTDANLPISVADLKTRMRVTIASEDAFIKECIKTATIMLEKYTHRSFVEQSHTLLIDQLRDEVNTLQIFLGSKAVIYLGSPPIVDVESVIFYADNGTATTVSSDDYYVDKKNGRIMPSGGYAWQTDQRTMNAVEIKYTAGYVELADVVCLDPTIVTAVAMLSIYLYDNRMGECDIPPGIRNIINSYKLVRIGNPYMGIGFNTQMLRSGSIGGY